HVERFVNAVQMPAARTASRYRITFARSGRVIDGNGSASLLEQAESAGLRPAHGCRMGICHSCTCRKLAGVVRNGLTGAVNAEPDDDIQLCIHAPRSDVTLDL